MVISRRPCWPCCAPWPWELSDGYANSHARDRNRSLGDRRPGGGSRRLHSHAAQDGYWLVLGGRAKFFAEGGVLLADLGKYEGAFVPHGTRYWFECGGDEPLEILRVSMNLPEDRV